MLCINDLLDDAFCNIDATYIDNTSAYQGVRNVRFSENLACFVFLVTLVLRFALLPYYRRFVGSLSRPLKWNLSSKILWDGLGNGVLKLNLFHSITLITPSRPVEKLSFKMLELFFISKSGPAVAAGTNCSSWKCCHSQAIL